MSDHRFAIHAVSPGARDPQEGAAIKAIKDLNHEMGESAGLLIIAVGGSVNPAWFANEIYARFDGREDPPAPSE